MFEELLSDLGKAIATGLLTGGAFVAMRGLALGPVRQYLRVPAAAFCRLQTMMASRYSRPTPTPARRTDGLVRPYIPSRAYKPPASPGWVHESNHDG
jgi:hypothetical protein